MMERRTKFGDKARDKFTAEVSDLTKLVTSVSFPQNDGDEERLIESSKRIYTHLLDNKWLRKVSEGNNRIPPLELLTYAIRNILFPSFLGPRRIPDILDLLLNVEHYRCVCKQKVETAAVLDEFYALRDRRAILLSKEERRCLAAIEAQAPSLRSRFLTLLLGYTQLDIHHLCTSSSRLSDMEERMGDYFENRFPFFPILAQEEQQQFTEMVDQSLRNSMKLVKEAHKLKSRDGNSVLDGKEMEILFPCPVPIEELVNSTDTYIRAVEIQVSTLKATFPT
ncbi:hypothetical protein E1B28_010062 [Marasmius oreades]|uniref:Uncharacterized protein n=1 Tax=Marasmius oreades TaxID=181124 RepID=A0A9P7URE1_9AGAR|nr:uncharacterized protein E1B28_010062 [Marasmius oreades]KAG7090995.1 hypothetical protein E1B28_010062 [Marasmius oreades]